MFPLLLKAAVSFRLSQDKVTVLLVSSQSYGISVIYSEKINIRFL